MKALKLAAIAALFVPALALAEARIAVVEPLQAIMETNEAKKLIGALQGEMKSTEQELLKLRGEIQKIVDRLEKEKMTMSREDQRKLSDERDAKMLDLRSRSQLAQKRMEEEQQQLLSTLEPKLYTALEQVAQEGKYDLIITRQAVLFARDEHDVTRAVTQKINQMD